MSTVRVPMPMVRMAESGHADDVYQQAKGADSQKLPQIMNLGASCESL